MRYFWFHDPYSRGANKHWDKRQIQLKDHAIQNVRGIAGICPTVTSPKSPWEHQGRCFREEFIGSNLGLDESSGIIVTLQKERLKTSKCPNFYVSSFPIPAFQSQIPNTCFLPLPMFETTWPSFFISKNCQDQASFSSLSPETGHVNSSGPTLWLCLQAAPAPLSQIWSQFPRLASFILPEPFLYQ